MARLQDPQLLTKETETQFADIRAPRNLRIVDATEDGTGCDQLPNGVYGYTYSPFEDNFPFFVQRELRNYESHKTQDGEVVVIGFLTVEEKSRFDGQDDATIHLFPEPNGDATEIVSLSSKRVVRRVEYSQRGAKGLEVYIRGSKQ